MTLDAALERFRVAEAASDIEATDEAARAILKADDPRREVEAARAEARAAVMSALAAAAETTDETERDAAIAKLDPKARAVFLETAPDAWPAMTAGELMSETDDALDWLVDRLLPAGGTSLLLGTPKSGKSTMARILAAKTAAGFQWYGRKVKAGPVLYVALDERRATVREHVRTLAASTPGPAEAAMRERLHVAFGPRPNDPAAALAAMLSGIDPAPVLVVVDTLMKAFPFEDANDYGLTGESMAAVTALAHDSGAHVMAIHHSRKNSDELATAALGSTRLGADVDVLIGLKVDTADNRRRLASFVGRDGVSEADIDVSFPDGDGRTAAGNYAKASRGDGFNEPPPR